MYTNSNSGGGGVEVAVASVIGREQRRVDRPCQDAFAVRRAEAATVVVLADGCGSGAHSELGARLGANLLASALTAGLGGAGDVPWRAACEEVLERLGALVPALGDGEVASAIARHLLFTIVAAVVTPERAEVLVIGDGIVAIGGELHVLESADDAPAYLAYELLGREVPARRFGADAGGGLCLALATDGARPLAAELSVWSREERWFARPDALRRRLALASREELEFDWERGEVVRRGGVLADDATVALVRRAP